MGKKIHEFTIRVSDEDRENFTIIGKKLRRSRSDALCYLAANLAAEVKAEQDQQASDQRS